MPAVMYLIIMGFHLFHLLLVYAYQDINGLLVILLAQVYVLMGTYIIRQLVLVLFFVVMV